MQYDPNPQYILLKHNKSGKTCFTGNFDDEKFFHELEQCYSIIGYAETIREAQTKLYGFSTTTSKD